ncbi:YrdB family protein [Evansella tamaricis]|uniref:YrdB family protein n=1 Tax=Evansella tamaricis TaxID=2069301 RepID=A0ABS6JHH2_9BACI|nr:YrdB family protein [Evansella tamaricis]MBU9713083.1 YrdB family protein [Evansella tamaricis]
MMSLGLMGLRFLLEVFSIIILCVWGFQSNSNQLIKLLLGIGAPVVLIVVWGLFGAPAAPYLLEGWNHFVLEVVIYGLATLALLKIGYPFLAIAFFIVAVGNRILLNWFGL